MSMTRRAEGARRAEVGVGKVFMNGRSQAVRLPKEFRFKGKEVRLRRVPEGVLLEEIPFDIDAWFASMDEIPGEFPDPPEQPPMPAIKNLFD